jgi:hypothetical protein
MLLIQPNVVKVLAEWYTTNVNHASGMGVGRTTALHLAARSRDCECLSILIAQVAEGDA